MKIKLVQIRDGRGQRRIGLVDEPELRLLRPEYDSVFRFASRAINGGEAVSDLIELSLTGDKLFYDDIYYGKSDWRLLPSFDQPDNPLSCMVSGTGLTHKANVEKSDQMQGVASRASGRTDSQIMYQWGVEGGKPASGVPGAQPEWFFKGNGVTLKGHGEALDVPFYARDGAEEAEVAGLYLINENGQPWRIGYTQGNEFSDHEMGKQNHLYLGPSKLRSCAIGPEVVLNPDFTDIHGKVFILRNQEVFWESELRSGEMNMIHSLENLEFHHFKHVQHRVPGQVHIHYFGTSSCSYNAGLSLLEGDLMRVSFEGFGRPLENTLRKGEDDAPSLKAKPLLI